MLRLKCPSCGLSDIDATSATFCSRCGRQLVGSLDDPYGWGSAAGVQKEAVPIDASRAEAEVVGVPTVAPITPVGFWPRTAAWCIDMVAIGIGVILFGFWSTLVSPFGPFMLWAAVFLYFTVCNKLGSSIGKATLGLKVVSVDERPIDWPRATLRSVFWLVAFASAGLGLLRIDWDEKRQGWHDRVSGTLVIKRGAGTEKALERIQLLARLRDQGLISEDEFESKKAELLSRP